MEMRKVVLDENIIPPMMHPWGKHGNNRTEIIWYLMTNMP